MASSQVWTIQGQEVFRFHESVGGVTTTVWAVVEFGTVLDEWINIHLILPTTVLEHVFQIKCITQVPVSKPVVKRLARLHHILFKVCSHLHLHSHLVRVPLQCGPQEIHGRSDTAHQICRWQGQPLRSGPERAYVMWSSPVVPPPLIHFSPQGIQADLHSFTCSTPPLCPPPTLPVNLPGR